MRIVIYYGGNRVGRNDNYDELMRLLEYTEIEMSRVPNKGEVLTLYLENYCIDMKVTQVFPHYCPEGNEFIKERAWGEWYGISVDEAEIIDVYGKRNKYKTE